MVDPRKRLKTVGLDADKTERQFNNSAEHVEEEETNDPETVALGDDSSWRLSKSSTEAENNRMVGFSGLSSEPLSEFADESSSGTPEQEGSETAPVAVIPVKSPGDRHSEATASATGLPLRYVPGIAETNEDDEKWNRMFSKMQVCKTQNQFSNRSLDTAWDSTLAEWIHNQRIQYWLFHHQGNGKISQARIERLNSIDFDWDIHQQRSTLRLSGEATPSSSLSSSGATSRKRKAVKGRAKDTGEKTRTQEPPDESSSSSDEAAASSSFPRREHSSSSDDEAATDSSTEFKKAEAPRLPDVVDAVEGVARLPSENLPGIVENSKHDAKWNASFIILQNYKRDFGNCNVPQVSDYDEKLGRWVHYQRVEYWVLQHQGHGKISQERIDALNSVGFDWDPQQTQWVKMYERLCAFKEATGHTVVGKSNSSDPELANWVRNQRLEHSYLVKGRKSRMTNERKLLLDALGFQWVLTMPS